MRTVLVVLAVASAATLIWLLSRPLAPVQAPPGPDAAVANSASEVTAAPERAALTREAGTTAQSPAATSRAPAPASEPAPTEERASQASYPVAVEVRSLVDNQLVSGFRWRFTSGEPPLNGDERFGAAELPLPIGATGDLRIEADGMVPFVEQNISPQRAPALRLQIYLRPTAPAAGITLLIHDIDRRPVSQIRVDAFSLRPGQQPGAWHLGEPEWSRVAKSDQGRFVLPALAPGGYGVQVRAVDDEDLPLPYAPFRRVYELTGGNGFLEDVTLEPACALRLDLYDVSGAPFDPMTRGAVRITLHAAGEPALPRRWIAARSGGALDRFRVSEVDLVPGPAPIWLATAAAPGPYILQLEVNGQTIARRPLQLAGSKQTERLLVP